jgi:hypothetical protein
MSDKLQFVAKLRQAKACRTSNRILTSVAGRLSRIPFRRMSENLANFINTRSRCCEDSVIGEAYDFQALRNHTSVALLIMMPRFVLAMDATIAFDYKICFAAIKVSDVSCIESKQFDSFPLAEELGRGPRLHRNTPSCLSLLPWEKGWGWGLRLKKPSCLA